MANKGKATEAFVTKPTFLKRTFSFGNLLITLILGMAVLAVLAKQYSYFNFDLSFTLFIQRFDNFWFDAVMKLVTFSGNVESMATLVFILSSFGYFIGKRHAPIVLIGSTFGGLVLSLLFKLAVSRPRPDPELVNQIGQFVYLDSFPSGHVMGAVSLYGFLLYIAYTQLKIGWLRSLIIIYSILIIILMGLSRIYVGAHWFSDVLGAYMLGFIWLSSVVFVYQKLKPRVKPR